MPEKITYSVDEMNTAITNYNKVKDQKLTAIEAMNSAVKTLDESYDGPAATIFMAAFDRLYENLRKSEQVMSNSIEKLQDALAALANAEDDTVSKTFESMLEAGANPPL